MHKIIFAQTKLNENNFTIRVWWALIEEIALRAKEMAGEKEMACCARGYIVYKNIWPAPIGEVLVCLHWCVIVGKICNFFHMFSVRENV